MKKPFIWFSKIFLLPIIKIFVERIEGEENLSKYPNFILASNHNNGWDHFFLGFILRNRLRDTRFIGAMDSFKVFLMSGFLYKLSNTISINRKRINREEFLDMLEGCLKGGRIIVIYPEGDSNKSKTLLKGKTGAAELSLRSGFPIIPVGIRKRKNSFKTVIKVGAPMIFSKEAEELRKMSRNSKEYPLLLRKVTDRIMQAISKLSGKPYKYED